MYVYFTSINQSVNQCVVYSQLTVVVPILVGVGAAASAGSPFSTANFAPVQPPLYLSLEPHSIRVDEVDSGERSVRLSSVASRFRFGV